MALSVSGGEFYMVELPSGRTLHKEESEAIDHLQESAEDIDPESEDVSVVRVSVSEGDWTIAEMSWQTIALRMMGEN